MLKIQVKKIAVTGGLSSGKSTVCRIFKQLGASVISADDIVHSLLIPSTQLAQQVIQLLGNEIVVNGQLDRAVIAKKVFNNSSLLLSLEKLLHPAVRDEIASQYRQVELVGITPFFIAEIPLLFETGFESFFDFTIAVFTEEKSCRERFCQSTGYPPEEYDKRMLRQLTPEDKALKADFVILNNSTKEDLEKSAMRLFEMLKEL